MNKYGCHNRPPFKPVVRSHQFGVSFPFAMSQDCQYTSTELGKVDHRCEGCKHKESSNATAKV